MGRKIQRDSQPVPEAPKEEVKTPVVDEKAEKEAAALKVEQERVAAIAPLNIITTLAARVQIFSVRVLGDRVIFSNGLDTQIVAMKPDVPITITMKQ